MTRKSKPVAQQSDANKRWRLSLDVNNDTYETIQRLAEMMDTRNKSEVLRRAIKLLEATMTAQQQGKSVGIARDGTDLATNFLLL